jgi:hypothetical protein
MRRQVCRPPRLRAAGAPGGGGAGDGEASSAFVEEKGYVVAVACGHQRLQRTSQQRSPERQKLRLQLTNFNLVAATPLRHLYLPADECTTLQLQLLLFLAVWDLF